MKRFPGCIILLLFFLNVLPARAQSYIEDVIYLNNGNIIRGQIVKLIPDSTLTIQVIGGSQLNFDIKEIDHVSKESILKELKSRGLPILRDSGFFNSYEIGFAIGNGETNWGRRSYSGFTFETNYGYYFNHYVALGAGIGLHEYSTGSILMFPLYLHFEGNVFYKAVTPFYFLNTGYELLWTNTVISGHGSPYLNLGLGTRFFTTRKVYWQISAGYLHSGAKIIIKDWNGTRTQELQYNRLTLRFGLTF